MKKLAAFGVTPGKITVIPSVSTELPTGQVKYEKAKMPRERVHPWIHRRRLGEQR